MLTAGYDSEFEVQYIGLSEITADATFVASIAANEIDPPLVTLRSSTGGIVRVSSTVRTDGKWLTVFRFIFPGATTVTWRGKSLLMDMARTDGVPAQHMGMRLRMKWHSPITCRSHLV